MLSRTIHCFLSSDVQKQQILKLRVLSENTPQRLKLVPEWPRGCLPLNTRVDCGLNFIMWHTQIKIIILANVSYWQSLKEKLISRAGETLTVDELHWKTAENGDGDIEEKKFSLLKVSWAQHQEMQRSFQSQYSKLIKKWQEILILSARSILGHNVSEKWSLRYMRIDHKSTSEVRSKWSRSVTEILKYPTAAFYLDKMSKGL